MRKFSSSTSRQRIRSFSISASRHYSRSSSTSTHNGSYQQAAVNVDSQNLVLPYILNIKISGTQLTGQVKVNGRIIKQFNSNDNQLNLSPFLSIGKNTIEILAPYSPSLTFMGLELLGPDIRVVQQTSGTGVLSHTLIVIVS